MSSTTLLQLAQRVTNELGLAAITSVGTNTSQNVVTTLALMNQCGYELLKKWEWQALETEYRFTTAALTTTGNTTNGSPIITNIPSTATLSATVYGLSPSSYIPQDAYILSVDSPTQVTINQNCTATATSTAITFGKTKYTLPTDFDKVINRTQWDKSKHWEMLGPLTPQQWQWLKSGYISTGPRVRWRLLDNYFQIWPVLSTNEYLGFEYVSDYWARDAAGTPKSSLTLDNDTCIYNDELFVAFSKLKYFQLRGFETTALQRAFDDQMQLVMATEQGAPILSMSPRISNVLVGWENIPDSGYGS